MDRRQQNGIRAAGTIVAAVLPVAFNPFVDFPFEGTKAILLNALVLVMVCVVLLPSFARRLTGPQLSTTSPSITTMQLLAQSPLMLPVLSYATIHLLATAFSINRELSVWGYRDGHGIFTTVAGFLLFLILTTALRRRKHVDQLVSALIIGSVPVAFYGWIQFFGLDALEWKTASISPIHSTLGRSVYLGAYLAMVAPYALVRVLQATTSRQRRLRYMAIFFLQISCLVITLARGAWIGLMGGLVVFTVTMAFRGRRWVWRTLILMSVGTALFLFIAFSGEILLAGGSRALDSTRFDNYRSSSVSARLATWEDALQLIPGRWLLGYGPESYAFALDEKGVIVLGDEPGWWHQDDPHNLFLSLLVTVGVAGLLAFLWIVARFFRLCVGFVNKEQSSPDAMLVTAILGSTVAYLISLQFNPDVVALTSTFWLNLALGTAVVRLRQRSHHV
jgi:O-antigen ligase